MADRNLYYLHDLSDYKVDSDYPDVRGWNIYGSKGTCIGKVDNLLVNKEAERVVYLDVDAADFVKDSNAAMAKPASEGVHGFVNKDGEDHLIVPIGMVSLDEDNHRVVCDSLDRDTFSRTKPMRRGTTPSSEYEIDVYRVYTNRNDDVVVVDDKFYNRPEFRNDRNRGPAPR